ncbi:MAG: hypothetical protein JOZ31_01000 [Verrucomicrobia bacterium]|nr:hypothetical protein [Verrucomicrobiota bacterium]
MSGTTDVAGITANIVTAITAPIDVATNIANLILNHSGSSSNDDQDSLVEGYCNLVWHSLQGCGKSEFTVVMYKSNLDHDLHYQRGGYVGWVQLGAAGYDIYFVANGYIANKGARGFANWCVQGNQRQDGNVITFT